MKTWEFAADGPVNADIRLPAGSVTVTATQTETITVSLTPDGRGGERLAEETEVSFDGGTLSVHTPRRVQVRGSAGLDLRIELPEGSSVKSDTASADLTCSGELGSLDGKTASGDVNADRISGNVDFGTASGDIQLGDVGGDARVHTASGDVIIERAGGEIIAKTASGDVRVGQAGQSASIKTASGDIRIDAVAAGLADATTVSGDITIAVVAGIGVYMDISTLSGHVRSELDSESSSSSANGEPDLTVSCRSVSGDVRILRGPGQ